MILILTILLFFELIYLNFHLFIFTFQLLNSLNLRFVTSNMLFDLIRIVSDDIKLLLNIELLLLRSQISQRLFILSRGKLFLKDLNFIPKTFDLLFLIFRV